MVSENMIFKLQKAYLLFIYTEEHLKTIKTYNPTLPEQQKIAILLSLLDERIATQNKIIEDLKKLKCAIIEKVLNGNNANNLRLGDVGSYIRGLTYSSDDVVEYNSTLVMRSNNIVNGSLLDYQKTMSCLSTNKYPKSSNYKIWGYYYLHGEWKFCFGWKIIIL